MILARKLRTAARVFRQLEHREVWSLIFKNANAAVRTLPGGLVRLGTLAFRPSDEPTRELLLSGSYEAPERRAARRYIRGDVPVVELGASLGVVSCTVNRRLADRTRHVAVEANPSVLPILKENRDRNGCRFEIVHGAAGAAGETVRFYIGSDALCSSALTASGECVEVPCISLQEILDPRGFERCALVSDIEGAEIALIRAEMPLLRARAEMLIVEFHPAINGVDEVADVQRLLVENGFVLSWRQADVFVFENSALRALV